MQYRDCTLRPAAKGQGFVCSLHSAPILTGCQLGASRGGQRPDCAALRERIADFSDALRDLVGDPESGIRPPGRLPAWFQRVVATQAGFAARVALAGAPRTVSTVLALLARDRWGTVRAMVAARPDLREAVQGALAQSEDPGTRAVLAKNPTITPATQHMLVRDPDQWVRKALAENVAAIPAVQKTLARDSVVRHMRACESVGFLDVDLG